MISSIEEQYREMNKNPTRTITRILWGDRRIHTDWNPYLNAYVQKTASHITAIFRIRQ